MIKSWWFFNISKAALDDQVKRGTRLRRSGPNTRNHIWFVLECHDDINDVKRQPGPPLADRFWPWFSLSFSALPNSICSVALLNVLSFFPSCSISLVTLFTSSNNSNRLGSFPISGGKKNQLPPRASRTQPPLNARNRPADKQWRIWLSQQAAVAGNKVTAARGVGAKYVSITERSEWQRHDPITKADPFSRVRWKTDKRNERYLWPDGGRKVVPPDSISKIGKSFDTGQSMKRPRLDVPNNKRRKETRISFTHLSKVSIAAKLVDRRFWRISQKNGTMRGFFENAYSNLKWNSW